MYGATDMKPRISDTGMRKHGFGWRHIVSFLGFFAFFCIYALRVNLSVALVAMVNHTATVKSATNTNVTQCSQRHDSPIANKTSDFQATTTGEFNWDEQTQGLILGAFFYGYITTQIPGGLIASKYGGKWLLGVGVLCTSLLTLLTPLAARHSSGMLIGLRVLEGIGEGVTWPAMHSMLSKWAPPMETTFLAAAAYTGSNAGSVVAFTSGGYLCDSVWGWPSVFYVYGVLGCIWFVLWSIFTADSPETHRWISEEEKEYINASKDGEGVRAAKFKEMPWKSIFLSTPVWAICVSHFAQNWGHYTFLTELPKYFKNVLGFDIKKSGVVSALPSLLLLFTHVLFGHLGDLVRTKFKMETTHARKFFNCTGLVLAGVVLVIVGYVGCNGMLAVALLTCSSGILGMNYAGYQVNHLDIAPRFAGLLFGISNTVATIPGFLSPYITGQVLVGNAHSASAWRTLFFITVGVYMFSAGFYLVFAAGNVQHWALDTKPTVNSVKKLGYENQATDMDHADDVLHSCEKF